MENFKTWIFESSLLTLYYVLSVLLFLFDREIYIKDSQDNIFNNVHSSY